MPSPLVPTATLGAQGGTIGRPRKQPPVEAAKKIEDLAAAGRGIVGVAVMLGTTRETLRRWMSKDSTLQEAFERGRERERHELHNILLRDARDGEQPNRLNITFNLPGAMTRDDFLKTVVSDERSR